MSSIVNRPHRLTVRTQGFQSWNRSSILRGVMVEVFFTKKHQKWCFFVFRKFTMTPSKQKALLASENRKAERCCFATSEPGQEPHSIFGVKRTKILM